MKTLSAFLLILSIGQASAISPQRVECVAALMQEGHTQSQAIKSCFRTQSAECVERIMIDENTARRWAEKDIPVVAYKMCKKVTSDFCMEEAMTHDRLHSVEAAEACEGMNDDGCFIMTMKMYQRNPQAAQIAANYCRK